MFAIRINNFKKTVIIIAVVSAIIGIAVFYFFNSKTRNAIVRVEYQTQRTKAFYNEDSLRGDLQKQGLWMDLQKLKGVSRQSVPPIAYSYVPDILENIKDTQNLKNSFVSLILPLALIANEEIAQERTFALEIRTKQKADLPVSADMEEALLLLFVRYGCKDGDFDCLLHRSRPVPVALTIAQAAIESGWGASRFARQGNAIYGQWTNAGAAKSIVAKETRGNQIIHLRAFDNLLSSVRSYMLNLNTHNAYEDFRKARLLYAKGALDLNDLLKTLEAYAEKGDYFSLISRVIYDNNLQHLNRAELQNAR